MTLVLEADGAEAGKTPSENSKDLKETVGEYPEDSIVIAIGGWRKSDSGYEGAEILPILLSVAM